MKQYKISVRTLVEFILRSGDISSGYAGGVRANLRALEGGRLHRKLQKAEKGDYAAEVTMSRTIPLTDDAGNVYAELLTEGRADGIFTFAGDMLDQELKLREKLRESISASDRKKEQLALETEERSDAGGGQKDAEGADDDLALLERDRVYRTVDEIKSTELSLKYIDTGTNPLHFAQAECYAYFLAEEEELPEVLVRLTYIQVETEKVKHLFRLYSREELQQFFSRLTGEYERWIRWQDAWEKERNRSLTELKFPFESYRRGQRAMAAYVYRTIDEKKKIFIQAPTGIGKTMSVLFPSLKAMGEGKNEKVFYLTAKNVTGEAAERAAVLLRKQDMRLKTLRITSKDRICFLEKRNCSPVECPYARGHYDRVNEAVLTALKEVDLFDREMICRIAEENRVCPYELSLDIASWCDLIICDYNYAFDPSASLKRFFMNGEQEYTLLVDEAHNLADRARSMFSADLTKAECLQFRKTLDKNGEASGPLVRALNRVNRLFLDADKGLKNLEQENGQDSIGWARVRDLRTAAGSSLNDAAALAVNLLSDKMGDYFEQCGREGREIPEEAWELYFRVLFFLRIQADSEEGYECYIERNRRDLRWNLFCVDPSRQLKTVYANVRSVIFFSATLTPVDYYRTLLGAEAEDEAISLPSPFDPSRRKTMIAPVPVSYQYRAGTLQKVSDVICTSVSARAGHYLVFFPSYAYLEQVMDRLEKDHPGLRTFRQGTTMTEEERLEFLERFRTDPEPLLGAAVLGGVFSEGIDLKGEALIGTIVVTVGLPQLGLERNLIREYFDRANGEGFDYSYRYPGIGRVFQAVGRVIRTEEDRGMVLLIDRRFGEERYLNLFPEEWFPMEKADENSVTGILEKFWDDSSE